mgnify:CR=1 FL=1
MQEEHEEKLRRLHEFQVAQNMQAFNDLVDVPKLKDSAQNKLMSFTQKKAPPKMIVKTTFLRHTLDDEEEETRRTNKTPKPNEEGYKTFNADKTQTEIQSSMRKSPTRPATEALKFRKDIVVPDYSDQLLTAIESHKVVMPDNHTEPDERKEFSPPKFTLSVIENTNDNSVVSAPNKDKEVMPQTLSQFSKFAPVDVRPSTSPHLKSYEIRTSMDFKSKTGAGWKIFPKKFIITSPTNATDSIKLLEEDLKFLEKEREIATRELHSQSTKARHGKHLSEGAFNKVISPRTASATRNNIIMNQSLVKSQNRIENKSPVRLSPFKPNSILTLDEPEAYKPPVVGAITTKAVVMKDKLTLSKLLKKPNKKSQANTEYKSNPNPEPRKQTTPRDQLLPTLSASDFKSPKAKTTNFFTRYADVRTSKKDIEGSSPRLEKQPMYKTRLVGKNDKVSDKPKMVLVEAHPHVLTLELNMEGKKAKLEKNRGQLKSYNVQHIQSMIKKGK